MKIITHTEVTKSVNKNNADHSVLFEAVNLIIKQGVCVRVCVCTPSPHTPLGCVAPRAHIRTGARDSFGVFQCVAHGDWRRQRQ